MREVDSSELELSKALQRMHLLDASAAEEFQRILKLAADIAGSRAAFLCFGTGDERNLVLCGPLGAGQSDTVAAFCDEVLKSGPTEAHRSFHNFESRDGLNFAAMSVSAGHFRVGTFGVIAQEAQPLETRELAMLTVLAQQLETQLEHRLEVTMQTTLNARLVEALARATDRKGDALQAAARLDALFNGLPVACFTFDLDLNVREWNWSAERLFGIPAHEAADRSIYDVLSNSQAARRVKPLVDAVLNGMTVADVVWSYRRADGKRLRISTRAFPVFDQHQQIVGVVSTHTDMTALHEHEIALRSSENRLRTTLASMRDGVLLYDRNASVLYANPSSERILGITKAHIEGHVAGTLSTTLLRPDESVLPREEHPAVVALYTGEALHDQIYGVRRTDGEIIWIELDCTPLRGESSSVPTAAVCTFSDITRRVNDERIIQDQIRDLTDYSRQLDAKQAELEEANRLLEALASMDGLTGLLNHRTFQDALEREFRLAVRTQSNFSLVFVDIDQFKSFNDEFGHQAGDAILAGVALTLKETVRETDIVARYGGEEIVVALPDTDKFGAILVAEKLRLTLEQTKWDHRKVTASFGVSTLNDAVHQRQDLLEQADRALYFSKSHGRNRVTHFSDLPKLKRVA